MNNSDGDSANVLAVIGKEEKADEPARVDETSKSLDKDEVLPEPTPVITDTMDGMAFAGNNDGLNPDEASRKEVESHPPADVDEQSTPVKQLESATPSREGTPAAGEGSTSPTTDIHNGGNSGYDAVGRDETDVKVDEPPARLEETKPATTQSTDHDRVGDGEGVAGRPDEPGAAAEVGAASRSDRATAADEGAPQVPPPTKRSDIGGAPSSQPAAHSSTSRDGRGRKEKRSTPLVVREEPRTANSTITKTSTTSTPASKAKARQQGREGLVAQEHARQSEVTHTFWSNRLRLLRKEVEAARIKAHMRRLEDDHHEASALANATLASQLRAEREHSEAHRAERAEAIRQQRESRRVAFRASLHQTVLTKLEGSRLMKAEAQQQRSMVQQLREEVLENKRGQRLKVIEEKEKAVEKRRKEKALNEEKATRLYAVKIDHLHDETLRKDEETRSFVEESGRLLEQLRRLQQLDGAKGGEVTAHAIEEAASE